jgi:hypothetical protein
LIVLSGEKTAVGSEYRNMWMELQTDLARLSARGKLVSLHESRGDLIYWAPHAIIEASLQVVGDVRLGRLR